MLNHAVSCELLTDLRKGNLEGATLDDAIERLRLRTVPPGYTIHTYSTWTEGICIRGQHHNIGFLKGKDETKTEKFRSILAQLEYSYQVNSYNSEGIPFKKHLYVPEVHPSTGVGFCEREDEGHLFKVQYLCEHNILIILIFRELVIVTDKAILVTFSWRGLQKHYMIRQQSTLSGVQKQSVEDVDRLFSQLLIDWMKQKGYTDEATYL